MLMLVLYQSKTFLNEIFHMVGFTMVFVRACSRTTDYLCKSMFMNIFPFQMEALNSHIGYKVLAIPQITPNLAYNY